MNFDPYLLPGESYIGYFDDFVAEVRVFRFSSTIDDESLEGRVETPFNWFDQYDESEIAMRVVAAFRTEMFKYGVAAMLRAFAQLALIQDEREEQRQGAYKWN